jgi:hypothetical protein
MSALLRSHFCVKILKIGNIRLFLETWRVAK